MLAELFDSGALNLVYAGVVLVSFIFAVISLVGAEVGDVFDFDADTDSGLDAINISPFAMAMFGATFGIAGLITRIWLNMEPVPSILWATGLGIVVGGLAQAFFLYILSPSKSSHFRLQDDAIGREAEVITSIPPDGLGEIAFNNVSGRVKLGARSTTGRVIRVGEVVIVEKIVGRVAYVEPSVDKAGES